MYELENMLLQMQEHLEKVVTQATNMKNHFI